jgi:NAD(P)-dependent dehydrogenase (short-subunit alcohol dehydrogenase family)
VEDLRERVAVVTGGASGIGLALADRLAGEGARVVLADVEEAALAEAAKALAATHGEGNVLAVPTDVRDATAVESLASATVDAFGAVHLLFNNAGVSLGGLFWTIPEERWRWIVDVNLLGVVHGVRAFVPIMIEQGEGYVVNTASAAGLVGGGPGQAAYSATKHAVIALTESLYNDLHATDADIGVSVLCPEWVKTRIFESERNAPPGPASLDALPDSSRDIVERFMELTMAGAIDPADVAGMVLDSVRARRFWIMTHESTVVSAQRRWTAIAEGAEPAFW